MSANRDVIKEIHGASVDRVDAVDGPAHGMPFLILKSQGAGADLARLMQQQGVAESVLGSDSTDVDRATSAQAALRSALSDAVSDQGGSNMGRLRVQNAAQDLAVAMVKSKLADVAAGKALAEELASPRILKASSAIEADNFATQSPTLRRLDLQKRVKYATERSELLVHLFKSAGLKNPSADQASKAIKALRDLQQQASDLAADNPDAKAALDQLVAMLEQQVGTLAALTVQPSSVNPPKPPPPPPPAEAIAQQAAQAQAAQPVDPATAQVQKSLEVVSDVIKARSR